MNNVRKSVSLAQNVHQRTADTSFVACESISGISSPNMKVKVTGSWSEVKVTDAKMFSFEVIILRSN